MTIKNFQEAERIVASITQLESELNKWKQSDGFKQILLNQPVGIGTNTVDLGYVSFNSVKADVIKKIEMRIKENKKRFEVL